MTSNWKRAIGLPTVKQRATWVDYVTLVLAFVPMLVVLWILQGYEVPEWLAVVIALGWSFPALYVASRITAWREREPRV